MKCSKCGHENSEGAQFCGICGTNLGPGQVATETICGHKNLEGAQFCGICGTNLGSGQVASEAILPMVNWDEAITRGLSNYVNFNGRARRSEYWFWFLFYSLIGLVPFIGGIISLGLFIPTLAVSSRRLHDIGKTGWWQLAMYGAAAVAWIVSFIFFLAALIALEDPDAQIRGFIIIAGLSFIAALPATAWCIIWMARQGERGPNKYGPDPKLETTQ